MVSEAKLFSVVETIRHGERPSYEEELTEEGIEKIRTEKAQEIYDDVMDHQLGSIFYIASSPRSRAQQTRTTLEVALQDIAKKQNETTIGFVDFSDKSQLESVKTDTTKRWIVLGVADIEALGELQGNPSAHAWDKMQTEFEKRASDKKEMEKYVHNLISKIQVAQAHELEALISEIQQFIPDSREEIINTFHPEQFLVRTPEDEAIEQLEAIYTQTQNVDRVFPGKHVHARIVGHAPVIDFVTMALLGKEITLAGWNEFGGIRDYLESDFLEFDEEGKLVHASFREHGIGDIAQPIDIQDIIIRLRKQSDERRAAWQALGVEE